MEIFGFLGKIRTILLTYSVFVVKYFSICKSSAETKRLKVPKREGDGVSPLYGRPQATSKLPGMTGTGAPVTEQLRYRYAVIRVVPRFTSPLYSGVGCFLLHEFENGGYFHVQQALWRK